MFIEINEILFKTKDIMEIKKGDDGYHHYYIYVSFYDEDRAGYTWDFNHDKSYRDLCFDNIKNTLSFQK